MGKRRLLFQVMSLFADLLPSSSSFVRSSVPTPLHDLADVNSVAEIEKEGRLNEAEKWAVELFEEMLQDEASFPFKTVGVQRF